MTTRDTPWPAGMPCSADLAVPDIKAATEFYGSVFGWTFTDAGEEFGHYQVCQVGDRVAAGISALDEQDEQAGWTIFLASDDVDGTGKLITENGGSIVVEPFDVGDHGRLLVARDNTGGVFGVWQAGNSIGATIANEPGSLVWEDCRLSDPDAGKRFYSAVFGFTYAPIPGAPSDYAGFQVNGEIAGGIGGMYGLPEGTPSHWLPYFSVSDVDATSAAVERGGGTVRRAAEDTPYGRMCSVVDPFGAVFALNGPNKEG